VLAFVRLGALRAQVRYRRVVVVERCCVARVLSVAAAAVAGSPWYALVRHGSCDRACRSRSVALLSYKSRQRLRHSYRHSAAIVVCALDAAAAPPSCVTMVLTGMFGVKCGCVRRCGAVCLNVCVFCFRERQCVAVLLCRCVCGTALHWTVAVAVSGSSRTEAAAMRRSLRSGCGAVS
jgi:hypothetical protein